MAGTRAALKLDDMAARRGSPSAAPTTGDDARRGQTLRLKPAAWTQLKILAAEQGKPSHDLLIEAVNLLFDHYCKPPIAG
jgi:hypothetical protein